MRIVRRRSGGLGWIVGVLVLSTLASSLEAQPPERREAVAIPRISGPVDLDGVVDEAAWDAVDPFPMTMYSPTLGGPMTEVTEIRVAHDDRHLYVSGRMWDTEAERIRTGTLYRDTYSGDDILAVLIDGYNDYETALWFVTNPAGVRQDRTVANDAQFTRGMPMNADWNSHWEVATSVDGEGWYAEFRIPFSTLGFQAVDGQVTMGLIAYRVVARKNERQTYPAMDPSSGRLGFARPSWAQRIALSGVRPATPLYVTPYALGGYRSEPASEEVPDGAAAWRVERDPTAEVGLDVKFSPTSNLALDVTVNTDFAQVEADDQQINLTRFGLFFPEKRQFFQERASTFDFGTGGASNRLFHSRRIGLRDGDLVRILGGVRAVGRLDGTDFGLLTMQTAASADRGSENMGVARVRQQVFNPYSSVGAIVTTRLGAGEGDNVAYGLDGTFRLVGDEYLQFQWAGTFDDGVADAGALESALARVRLERRRDDGFSYGAEAARVGADYRPGLGFQLRDDYLSGEAQLRYRQFQDDGSALLARSATLTAVGYRRNADGSLETREIAPEVEFEFRGGETLTLSATSTFESVRDPFRVADLEIPAGEYRALEGGATLQLPRSSVFRGEYSLSAGSFYGGRRLGFAVGPVWTASKHLELEGLYEANLLDFEARAERATVHLARLKVKTALNPRLSMSAFGQYNGTLARTSLNVRLRFHVREGTDLWAVYNEDLRTGRQDDADPRSPRSVGRALMVKYSHAFVR